MVASGIGVSVISAAILEGNLILGLSDGSVINAGVAQGPMGLTGPQGPMGATGRPGRDGNTIHSVEGAPSYDLGTDGDFAINTVEWEVYGPKASGQWGTGTPMIGGGGRNKREVNKGGDTRTEGGGGDNRPPIISPDGDITPPTQYPGAKPIHNGDFWVDGNGALHVYYRGQWNKVRVYSDMVLPAGDAPAGSSRDVEGSVTVPGNGGTGQAIAEAANGETFANQYEYNNWVYYRVDRPPIVADDEPAEHPNFPVTGLSAGDFWINAGDQLFTWKDDQWAPLFAKGLLTVQDTMPDPAESQEGELWFNTDEAHLTLYVFDGAVWVPAAPPVSLDGIETSITGIEGDLIELHNNVRDVKGDVVLTNQDLQALAQDQKRQDDELKVLEGEIEQLAPSFERGAWNYDDGDGIAQGTEYVLSGVQTQESYDAAKAPIDAELIACNEAAAGDSAAMAQCNRDYDTALRDLTPVGETIKSNQWELANKVTFDYMDLDGRGHMFDDVKKGQLLDMVCEDGSGFMVAEITGITLGLWYENKTLDIKPIQFKGVANGRTTVKIFSINDSVGPEELTNFVRKSGDTMTGKLIVAPDSGSAPSVEFKPAPDAPDARGVIFTRDKNNQVSFIVTKGGSPRAGRDENNPFIAQIDWDLTTKKYVDDAVAATTTWTYRKDNLNPVQGEFSFKDNGGGRIDLIVANKTAEGILWVEGHGREADSYFDNSFFVTVTRADGNFMIIAQCSGAAWSRKNKPHSYVSLKNAEFELTLVDGEQYCIQIPALLPLIKF